MSELIKRTLSGAVFIAVIIGSLLYYPQAFRYIAALLAMFGAREMHILLGDRRLTMLLSSLAAGLLMVNPLLSAAIVGFTLIIELYTKAEHPVDHWGHVLVAQAMIGLPFLTMTRLTDRDPHLLLALFILIWTNDTLAYCTGSLLSKRPGGNHAMFPRVSPKKSWEGLTGGLVAAILAGAVLAHYGWLPACPCHVALSGGVLALIIAIAGTFGDLMESLLKRSVGVKDSGRFLPGHGGILDRFDSMLLAAPVLYALLLI